MMASEGKTRRAPAWLLALAIALVAGSAHAQAPAGAPIDLAQPGQAQPAQAQPDPGQPVQLQPAQAEPGQMRIMQQPGQAGEAHGAHDGHGHAGAAAPGAPTLTESSPGAALFFWVFALMTVVGSVFVITRRNLISAVMGMVGTFFAIAAVFTMLYAHFLAAIQVLVYAGAIMVLFVFVIMIMNKPEDHPWGRVGTFGNLVSAGLILYLLYRMGTVLWHVPVDPRMVAPPPQVAISHGTVEEMVDFGTTKAIGDSLFHEYLFPFEAVSLVLLIAVVGALAVARPHEKSPAAPTASTPSSKA